MAKSPLQSLGIWRGMEGAVEAGIPLMCAGTSWWAASKAFGNLSPVRPYTQIELGVILGACVAVTAWAVSRQMFMLRRRNPWFIVLVALVFSTGGLAGLPTLVEGSVEDACGELSGELTTSSPLLKRDAPLQVCALPGVPGNPYLPGVLLRPAWDGSLHPITWGFLALCGLLGALGLRDQRIRPTRLALKLYQELRLAPAQGLKSAAGEPSASFQSMQACGNPTLWGETCGQLYSGDKVFEPGERCVRCHQAYRRATGEVTLDIATLLSGDVDVLNGLERVDTNSWTPGDGMPPDGRISGMERWGILGRVTVPNVITIAQLLAVVHDELGAMESDAKTPELENAAKLAQERASKVACWLWKGRVNHKLTFANPSRNTILAIGPMRLKDLLPNTGDAITLQLDIGLLPLNMRVGFKMSFVEEGRAPVSENSAFNIWVPTSPPKTEKGREGLWVPRIEGDALRAWLSTERLRPEDERGATTPLPYLPDSEPPQELAERAGYLQARTVRAGSLDLVRMEMRNSGKDVDLNRRPGDSIAEWKWLEWEQIELLRNEALVLIESGEA